MNNTLTPAQRNDLLATLKTRFDKNAKRHKDIAWANVAARLEANAGKVAALYEMEQTGGEPDVTGYDAATGEYLFVDCSAESPSGRRSLCFDREALDARKENKPAGSALDMAEEMGIEMLNETQYRELQQLGVFDAKTSSWIQTPANIRKLGGALFADYRYATVFVYHNGAQSYYAARGFRGMLRV